MQSRRQKSRQHERETGYKPPSMGCRSQAKSYVQRTFLLHENYDGARLHLGRRFLHLKYENGGCVRNATAYLVPPSGKRNRETDLSFSELLHLLLVSLTKKKAQERSIFSSLLPGLREPYNRFSNCTAALAHGTRCRAVGKTPLRQLGGRTVRPAVLSAKRKIGDRSTQRSLLARPAVQGLGDSHFCSDHRCSPQLNAGGETEAVSNPNVPCRRSDGRSS